MGRASSFNEAHNSSKQQGDLAYRAIDEHEGGCCFYSWAGKAFPGTNGKVGRASFNHRPFLSLLPGGVGALFSSFLTFLLSLGAGLVVLGIFAVPSFTACGLGL